MRFCSRGNLPYSATKNSQCFCSITMGDSKMPANLKRKYLTDCGLWFLWKFNLPLISSPLSLLPIYTTSFLVSPSSYMPYLLGTSHNFAFVNTDHRLGIGIFSLLQQRRHQCKSGEHRNRVQQEPPRS